MSTSIVFSAELWGKFKKKQDTLHEIKEKYAVNIENPNVSDYKTFIHINVLGSSAKSLSAKEKLIADFELFNKPKPPKAPSQKSRRSTDLLVSIGKWEKYKDEYRALAREHDVDLNSGPGSTKDFRVVQIQPSINARADVQSVRDLILQRVDSSPYSNDYDSMASKSQQHVNKMQDLSDMNKQHDRQQTGQDSTRHQTTIRVYQNKHIEKGLSNIYADPGTQDSNMRNLDNEPMWKGNQTGRKSARDIISSQLVTKFTSDGQSGNGSKSTMYSNESGRSNKGNKPHSYMSVESIEQLRPTSNAHNRAEQPYAKAMSCTPETFQDCHYGQNPGSRYAAQSKMPQTERRNVDGISFEDQPIDRQLFIEANKEAYNEFYKKYQHKMIMFGQDGQGRQMLSLYIYDKKDESLRPEMNHRISKMFQTYQNYIELRQHGLKIEREEFLKINKKLYSKFQQKYANRVSIVQPDRDLLFIKIHNHGDDDLRSAVTENALEMYYAYLDTMGTPL